jgi:hypothetical protein
MLFFIIAQIVVCVSTIVKHPGADSVGDGFADDCADQEVALRSLDCIGCTFIPTEDKS